MALNFQFVKMSFESIEAELLLMYEILIKVLCHVLVFMRDTCGKLGSQVNPCELLSEWARLSF